MTTTLLLDNSAWVRLADAGLPAERADEIAEALESGRIAASLPFLLEAGYSARSAREHAELLAELPLPPPLPARRLRRRPCSRCPGPAGRRRPPPAPSLDLHIAALADRHGLGVLHYDHDYDLIAEKTDLAFDSVWLAARRTLRRL